MKIFVLSLVSGIALAASSTTSAPSTVPSSASITVTSSVTTSVNNSVAEYSITDLPAVTSQPSCIFNCLIPIGLADSSGCDDVTNDCACLSAPIDAAAFLTDCVATVCHSSTSEYAATATSLYASYCMSVYGADSISSAASVNSVSDASAAAASSSSSSANATTSAKGSASTTASTSKSEAWGSAPRSLTMALGIFGSFVLVAAL